MDDVELLFDVTGSVVADETVAELRRLPVWLGASVPAIRTVNDAPAASEALVQVTFCPDTEQVTPGGPLAVMPLTAAGTASDRLTEVAIEGPLFVTVTFQDAVVPGMNEVALAAVLTASRSAAVVMGVVEFAALFALVGSLVGEAIVAVFVRLPVAVGATVPRTVIVAVALGAMDGAEHVTVCPLTAHVQPVVAVVAEIPVTVFGRVSVTVGLTAVEGPALVAVNVQVAWDPATRGDVVAALASDRSALGAVAVVSESVLLAVLGSPEDDDVVAVLVRLPVKAGSRVPVIVTVAVAPTARVGALQLTFWPAIEHDQPEVTLLTARLVTAEGTTSERVGLVATDGPLLVTRTLQLTCWPGTKGVVAPTVTDLSATRPNWPRTGRSPGCWTR